MCCLVWFIFLFRLFNAIGDMVGYVLANDVFEKMSNIYEIIIKKFVLKLFETHETFFFNKTVASQNTHQLMWDGQSIFIF